jgi:hypothetical protein
MLIFCERTWGMPSVNVSLSAIFPRIVFRVQKLFKRFTKMSSNSLIIGRLSLLTFQLRTWLSFVYRINSTVLVCLCALVIYLIFQQNPLWWNTNMYNSSNQDIRTRNHVLFQSNTSRCMILCLHDTLFSRFSHQISYKFFFQSCMLRTYSAHPIWSNGYITFNIQYTLWMPSMCNILQNFFFLFLWPCTCNTLRQSSIFFHNKRLRDMRRFHFLILNLEALTSSKRGLLKRLSMPEKWKLLILTTRGM